MKCSKCGYEIAWEPNNPAMKIESGICGPRCDQIWTRVKKEKK